MSFDNLLHSPLLYRAAVIAYLVAGLLYAGALLSKPRTVAGGRVRLLAVVTLLLAFGVHTALLATRWIDAGRPPIKTLYETLLLSPWCICVVSLALLRAHRVHWLGAMCAASAAGILLYAGLRPDVATVHLPPALRSAWFVPHVAANFFAYAAFFVSFVLALLYLVSKGQRVEAMYVRTMECGFVLLTLGLAMGAVWGQSAWGAYWAWDPKENWALITWIIYLIAVHVRFAPGVGGRRRAILCVGGFVALLVTYLGVSSLPVADSSLHTYQ